MLSLVVADNGSPDASPHSLKPGRQNRLAEGPYIAVYIKGSAEDGTKNRGIAWQSLPTAISIP